MPGTPGPVNRWLAPAASPLPLRAPGYADGIGDPWPQLLGILEHVHRHLVVLHDLASRAAGTERAQPARLERGARRVVHLEVERIVVDEGEEEVAGVDPDAAEHALRPQAWCDAGELLEGESAESVADGHDGRYAGCGPTPSRNADRRCRNSRRAASGRAARATGVVRARCDP